MAQKTNIWIDGTQAGATLKTLQKEVAKLNREIKDLPRTSEDYEKKVEQLGQAKGAIDNHRNSVRSIANGYNETKKSMLDVIKQFNPMKAGFLAITAVGFGLFSAFRSGIGVIVDYESAISSLATLTGESGSGLEELKQKVMEVSTETGKGATEIAKAMELIGGANSDLLKNKDALADVTKQAVLLAQAGNMEVPEAAEAMAKSMNQFGAASNEAAKYADIYTTSQMKGTATINQLSASMVNAGSTARAFHLSFEETNALLQGFAKGGTTGSEAGTQLAGILSKLSKVQQKEFNPAYTNAIDVIDNLSKANLSYTDLVKLTDAEGAKWLSTLINQNKTVQDLNGTLNEQGAAQDAAAKNTDNIAGNYERLVTNMENYILGANGATGASNFLNGALKWLANNLEDVISWIGKAIAVWGIYKGVQAGLRLKEAAQDWIKQSQAVAKNTEAVKNNANAQKNASGAAQGLKGALTSIGWTALISVVAQAAMEFYDLASGAAAARYEAERFQESQAKFSEITNKKIGKINQELNDELAELRRKRQEGIIKSDKELAKLESDAVQRAKKNLYEQKKATVDRTNEMTEEYKKALQRKQQLEKQYGGTTGVIAIGAVNSSIAKEYTKVSTVVTAYQADIKALNSTLDIYTQQEHDLNEQLKDSESNFKSAGSGPTVYGSSLNKGKKAAEDFTNQLDELIKKVNEISSDNAFNDQLATYEDGLQKELFVLQNSLNEKYAAEIATAEELAKQKGDIGTKAQEQLNRLLQLKDAEYLRLKGELEKKYADEANAQAIEQNKQRNLNAIAQEESLQEALVEVKLARAQAAFNAVDKQDKQAFEKAKQELLDAQAESLEFQKQQKINALWDQYDQEQISMEELKLRELAIEQDFLAQKEQLNQESIDRIAQMNVERFEQSLTTIQEALGISMKFIESQAKKRLSILDKEKTQEEQNLEALYQNKIISEDEYNKQKELIDTKYEERKSKLQNELAAKRKAAAIAEAIIQGALAIAKVTAQTGVAAPFAIPLIIASTAAQIAAIETTDVNQYADGGYTEVTGKKDGLRYRAKNIGMLKGGFTPNNPSLALISEKGNEYFVPHHLMKDQRVANYVGMIDAIRTNQFADGGYTSGSGNGFGGDINSTLENNNAIMQLLYRALSNGISAKVDDRESERIANKISSVRKNRG